MDRYPLSKSWWKLREDDDEGVALDIVDEKDEADEEDWVSFVEDSCGC